MDYTEFIVSNQKEDSFSIQRVSGIAAAPVLLCVWLKDVKMQ